MQADTSLPPVRRHYGETYAIALVRESPGNFDSAGVLLGEMIVAFRAESFEVRTLDYREQPGPLLEALQDPRCAFFLGFNGFGSEVTIPGGPAGLLVSVFEAFAKPLFDIVCDCPSTEHMAHQVESRSPARWLLLTNGRDLQEASELGFPNIRLVPPIALPAAIPAPVNDGQDATVQFLLPLSFAPPAGVDERHDLDQGYRGRFYREVFHAVTERCRWDLELDPWAETRRACRQAGVSFDVQHPDARFLLTSIVDAVAFHRRRSLLATVADLPVTVIADPAIRDECAGSRLRFIAARSFRELLKAIADASAVICPLPGMSGFHEVALAAVTAGAALLAAPDALLEAGFLHGEEILVYRRLDELPGLIDGLAAHPERMREIGQAGRLQALGRFPAARLAGIILAQWRLRHAALWQARLATA